MHTIRAKVINGELVPLKPLPKDWKEGDLIEIYSHELITHPEPEDLPPKQKPRKRRVVKRSRRGSKRA